MSVEDDPRPRVAVTLAPLDPEPRMGLRQAARLRVPAVQLSAGQVGTRPRDLDRSGRRDLLVAARRLELEIAGIDAWFSSEALTDPDRVDAAMTALMESVELAAELGRLPISLRFPRDGVEDLIESLVMAGERVGVRILDHAAPPRGSRFDRVDSDTAPQGLLVPGEEEAAPTSVECGGAAIEGLGVGLDPPSWLVAGLDPLDAAGRGIESLRLADLTADGMRVPAGDPDGRVDLVALLATARVGGLEAIPVIDARRWADPVAGVQATLSRW